jgi:phosphate:Na+ symporter
MENTDRMVTALKEEDLLLAKEIVNVYADVDKRRYQLSHIERLQKGVQPSLDTSSIHLDLVNYYARINEHIVHIANRIIWLNEKSV